VVRLALRPQPHPPAHGSVRRDLGVRYVLEGSVRKAGNRVRVTGQLIDAESGAHIWAERFDRDLTDIFAVQDELTREIISALKIKLSEAEKALIVGFHFPFPSLGQIEKDGAGYRLVPSAWNPVL
jgi:hypothetical protein